MLAPPNDVRNMISTVRDDMALPVEPHGYRTTYRSPIFPAMRTASETLLLLVGTIIVSSSAYGQTDEATLFNILKQQDSLLFSVGFNTCDTSQFERLLSSDFEFYHDEGGITLSKRAFIQGFRTNVCGLNYRARRVLQEGTLEVYPLRQNGVLYGAVQTGIHRFYALRPGEPEQFTSRAKFTHVWILEGGSWRLTRGLSFDHQSRDTSWTPDFGSADQVNRWIKDHNVPALAIGVIHDGQLQSVNVYGELDTGRPAPVDAVFNVASLTKIITTLVTLKLVSTGTWNLDEPLYRYWTDPDVRDDPRSKVITTRHILNQRSGFSNWRWEEPARRLTFDFDPGTRYQYSGEGYEYLRRSIEAKFGKSLDALADELLFKPLGMNSTHFTWQDADSIRFAVPHDENGNALPVSRNTEANAADLVRTTIGDYGKLLVSALNGQGLADSIRAQMVHHATRTKEGRYIGLGWFIYAPLDDGEYALSHGGDDPGAHSIFFLLPKSRQGLLIFTNSDNGPKIYADIIRAYLKEKGEAIIDIEMK